MSKITNTAEIEHGEECATRFDAENCDCGAVDEFYATEQSLDSAVLTTHGLIDEVVDLRFRV